MIDSKLKCIFLSTLDQGSQFLLESKVKKSPVGQIYSIERMKTERERERERRCVEWWGRKNTASRPLGDLTA